MTTSEAKVAVIGSGLVGKSWAMIFAAAGNKVSLFDVDQRQLSKALSDIESDLFRFERDGVLKGSLSAEAQVRMVSAAKTLEEAVSGAAYVQECVPERLDLKRAVWSQVDAAVDSDATVMASSASTFLPSKISEELKRRDQFIVVHPINPPYHAPATELVPAPWTSDYTRETARQIMDRVGQNSVSLNREVGGFLINRLQYAILGEAWRLVASDVVSADDLDVVMRDGLGLRYALMGPMETIHLNAAGTQLYMDAYGKVMHEVSSDFGKIPEAWKQETKEHKEEVAKIASQLESLYPLDRLDERRARRDDFLCELAKLKSKFKRN